MAGELVLDIRDLSVRYGAGHDAVFAVRDATLTVAPGEAVGLVGESGSGKSTIARASVGLVRPHAGSIRVDDLEVASAVTRHFPGARRRFVQMVFQDPYSSLNPRQRAVDAVAEAIVRWRVVERRGARAAALELLASVGITADQADRMPAQLSGGQRQRVSLARALAPRPSLLIADEPTSSIDQSAQAQILNLLRTIQDTNGLAILFISHDLGIVRYLTDRAYVMKAGSIVESGRTAEVLGNPAHPYTRLLINAMSPAKTLRR